MGPSQLAFSTHSEQFLQMETLLKHKQYQQVTD